MRRFISNRSIPIKTLTALMLLPFLVSCSQKTTLSGIFGTSSNSGSSSTTPVIPTPSPSPTVTPDPQPTTSPTASPTPAPTSSSSSSPFNWVGIIGTGQSLGVGWESIAVSTVQPFKNLTLLDSGPSPQYPTNGATSAQWSVTPLVEPIRKTVPGSGPGYTDKQYPNNIYQANTGTASGESPHSGMANTLSALWASRGLGDYITAHSAVGTAGATLTLINKNGGGLSYPAALSETRVFKKLAQAAGKTYGVAGIVLTHGEGDATTPDYEAGLVQLWQDYNTDLKAITGQTRDVVIFGSQQSTVPGGYNSSAVQLWRAGVDNPGKIVCTGPKYAYGVYGLHMPAPSYERLGEKYAEVFDIVVNQGHTWKPLGPNKISRSGAVITISFDVPNPPLAWDSNLTPPHQNANTAWANGRGFEVVDGSMNQIAIASVAIQGNNVILTLAQVPAAGISLTVGYALTQDGTGTLGGDPLGLHGQLRDSDPFVGYAVETIAVQVTNGSTSISAASGGAFIRRASLDIVTGSGLPSGVMVSSINPDQITLSAPWTGSTGTTMLTFHHNHYNYGVHFSMAVP